MSWNIRQANNLYHIDAWSEGYVDINEKGHLCVMPFRQDRSLNIDLYDLIDTLIKEELTLPILVRFSDILKDRVKSLIKAFDHAIQEQQYKSHFIAVYPIKVNQQRRVIEDIVRAGDSRVGLESGSKPELLINIAMGRLGSKLICNGYKDREYIRLALIAKQIGFDCCIVIEKLSELQLIIECAEEMGVTPTLGIRIRLSSIATGKWQNTGGEKSKFGLHANQLLQAVKILEEHDLLSSLALLHFHIGSQVANLEDLKRGLLEGAQFYAQLRQQGIPIQTMDIGGGLGVDYEGTKSTRDNSINYTLDEYAYAVVETINNVCQQSNIDTPDIITESGRAMTAHHAMMITNITDIEESISKAVLSLENYSEHESVQGFIKLLNRCDEQNIQDCYQENASLYYDAKNLFANGQLNLKQWAEVDELYYAVLYRLYQIADSKHELIETLREKMAAKYFANFSLFQSMPDTWAINQIFPIVPLQRLDEKPDMRCTLQDLTCDSDGRVDYYVDGEGIETSLPIHSLKEGEQYLIGIFLLGAYQEILGDIHNLFGDSASVNVELSQDNKIELSEFDNGDKVCDLFQGIHIDVEAIREKYQSLIIASELDNDKKTDYLDHLMFGLEGYTYLEE